MYKRPQANHVEETPAPTTTTLSTQDGILPPCQRQHQHVTNIPAVSMATDALVQLICLEPSLVIASVKKHANHNLFSPFLSPSSTAAASQLVPWLLELLFYSSDRVGDGRRFLSYVETQHELSIVLEDALLAIFPPHALELEPTRWKALQVASAGAGAFLSQLSVLNELTTTLARNQISVFQISTYQTDFLLVKTEDLDRAIRCLRAFCDVEMESGEPYTPSHDSDAASESTALHLDPVKEVTLVHRHTLSVPAEIELFLVQIDKSCAKRHMYALVRLLFGPSDPQSDPHSGKHFLSYSEAGEDISVVTSDTAFVHEMQTLAYNGEPGVMVAPDCWKVVQIGDKNLGFSETGIVAGHTRVLLNAGTMVFYLSTYATDFMLIKEDEWPDALPVLRSHFRLVEGGFMPLTSGSEELSTL